jgi:cytochrome c biogenesis protein CcdA
MSATLLFSLISIAIIDSLNPSLFVAQFYLITTPHPLPRILSYIAGVMLVNFGGGVLLLGGLQTLVGNFLSNVSLELVYGVQLVFGLAILWFGLWYKTTTASHSVKKPSSLKPMHTFGLGIVVMLNEITTALPYFVAIERIVQAQLSVSGNFLALILYNVVFSAPLLGFVVLFIVFRQRFAAQLGRISEAIQRWTPRVIKYGSMLFGAVLALNGVLHFVARSALFD